MRLVAKHAEVGYQTPGERPGCRNCLHFEQGKRESSIATTGITLCMKHDLEITSGGICNDHRAMRKPGEHVVAHGWRQHQLDLGKRFEQALQPLVDARVFPAVGAIYEGKPMTVAKHRRLMVEQLITNEEASGDPELIRVAAMRRGFNGMPPQAGERRA